MMSGMYSLATRPCSPTHSGCVNVECLYSRLRLFRVSLCAIADGIALERMENVDPFIDFHFLVAIHAMLGQEDSY